MLDLLPTLTQEARFVAVAVAEDVLRRGRPVHHRELWRLLNTGRFPILLDDLRQVGLYK